VGTDLATGSSYVLIAPSITSDPATGFPVLIWGKSEIVTKDSASKSVVHAYAVRLSETWASANWSPVGSGDALNVSATSSVFSPVIVADSNGSLFATWYEVPAFDDSAEPSFTVHAKRFSGGSWSVLGGGPLNSNPSTRAGSPKIALDSAGNPVVAFDELNYETNVFSVFVKRLDGSTWTLLGDGAPLNVDSTTNAHIPVLAVDMGSPVVLWFEREAPGATSPGNVWLKRFNQ
jgi:hypothetical protein